MILNRGTTKKTREFLEGWASDHSAHTEICPIKKKINNCNASDHIKKEGDEDECTKNKTSANNSQLHSKSTKQPASHLLRNYQSSLLLEVYADEVVQNEYESSTTKRFNLENAMN